MININVSESFAFDFLSIYEVKFHKNPTSEIADKNYEECEDYISNQLGWDFYYEIVQSKEYNDLYESNKRLFELVELAKDDKVKASEVDRGVKIGTFIVFRAVCKASEALKAYDLGRRIGKHSPSLCCAGRPSTAISDSYLC